MVTSEIPIRRLLPADADAYRALRLFGLGEAPEAFGSDLPSESASPLEDFAQTLRDGYVAGAFAEDRLAGVAGFGQFDREKTRHRGFIWGVYVLPEARGHGLGRRVMQHVIEHARTRVVQVHLAVTASNLPAVRLYEGLGFERYGTEPRALCVEGRYLDEHLMVLRFP